MKTLGEALQEYFELRRGWALRCTTPDGCCRASSASWRSARPCTSLPGSRWSGAAGAIGTTREVGTPRGLRAPLRPFPQRHRCLDGDSSAGTLVGGNPTWIIAPMGPCATARPCPSNSSRVLFCLRYRTAQPGSISEASAGHCQPSSSTSR